MGLAANNVNGAGPLWRINFALDEVPMRERGITAALAAERPGYAAFVGDKLNVTTNK